MQHEVTPALAEDGRGSGAVPSPGNQSCASPGNEGSLQMLSISTIASAITNASISTDPSQLAAMILDLSKRSRTKRLPVSAGSSSEDSSAAQHVRLLALFAMLLVQRQELMLQHCKKWGFIVQSCTKRI